MKRSRIIESVLKMRFEEIYDRFRLGGVSCEEAADLLGVSSRTFLRKRERYEEEGAEVQFDRRLDRRSSNRAADEEVERITKLYADRFRGFSVKHFHEFAQREYGLIYSYTWTKNHLEGAGLVKREKRGGSHRLRRERKPMAGMMLHQDASTHEWIPGLGCNVDLIVTMDDATSVITSAFFTAQEGTRSSFLGIEETIDRYGLFCSFYTDRGSHYAYTPEAGGKVDKSRLTQVGRALKQLGVRHILAYSPQARGRSERMFSTLQGRLPKEIALAGIKTLEEANRFLRKTYLPRHNAQFSVEPAESQSAYIPWAGNALEEILCIKEERTVQPDNTLSYGGKKYQIPADAHRYHYVKTKVEVRSYKDRTVGVFYGHRRLGRYTQAGGLQDDLQLAA